MVNGFSVLKNVEYIFITANPFFKQCKDKKNEKKDKNFSPWRRISNDYWEKWNNDMYSDILQCKWKQERKGHEAITETLASSKYTTAMFCMTLIRGLNDKRNWTKSVSDFPWLPWLQISTDFTFFLSKHM